MTDITVVTTIKWVMGIFWTNQPISQSTNQSINQSIGQLDVFIVLELSTLIEMCT